MYEVELKVEITDKERQDLISKFKTINFSSEGVTPQDDYYIQAEKSPYGGYDLKRYRKRSPDESLDTLCEDGFDPGTDETERLIDSIDGMQAVRFLGEIREPYRKTIQMRYMQQLSIREIAGISEAGENTVVVRIHRGLHILHDLLDHAAKAQENQKVQA